MTFPSNYQLTTNDLDNTYIGVDDTNYSFINVTNRKTVIFGQGAISTTAVMYAIPNLGITGMAKPWIINTPKVDIDPVIVKGATSTAVYFLDTTKNVDYVRGGFNFFENIPQNTDLWQSTGLSNRSSPVQVGYTSNWNQITAGFWYVVGIKKDGTIWSWGNNSSGQLGLNTTTATISTPVQIGTSSNWATVSTQGTVGVSSQSCMAIETDGTLWSWGNNSFGQLGLNTISSNILTPVQVGALTNWSQVTVTDSNFFAIKTNGTLWVAGLGGSSGTTGLNTTTNYSSPVQVGALTNWSQVAIGGNGTVVAIKTDGTLWGWGYGGSYNLGNSSLSNFSSPIQIGADSDWSQVTASDYGTLAIKSNGTLWCWGYPVYGELGNNTASGTTPVPTPTQVGTDSNWFKVKMSNAGQVAYQCSSGIKTDGTLWVWGNNSQGQLGLNTTGSNIRTPVQLGALSGWSNIAMAELNSLFLYNDGTLYACGNNSSYQLGNQYDLARTDTNKRLTGF